MTYTSDVIDIVNSGVSSTNLVEWKDTGWGTNNILKKTLSEADLLALESKYTNRFTRISPFVSPLEYNPTLWYRSDFVYRDDAVQFTAADKSHLVETATDLDGLGFDGTELSGSCWVYQDSQSTTQVVVATYLQGKRFELSITSAGAVSIYYGGKTRVSADGVITIATWYCLMWGVDADNKITVILGETDGTATVIIEAETATTGTDLYPTTAAAIITAVESTAVSGDVVHVPAGTFTLAANLTIPAGVTVRGAGKTLTTIKPGNIIYANLGGSADAMAIEDLTIDLTGADKYLQLADGVINLTDVHVQGPASVARNSLTFGALTEATTVTLIRVSSDDSSKDNICFIAGSDALGLLSTATFYDCSATRCGPGATDNCLTTHNSYPIVDYCGTYDGGTNQIKVVNADKAESTITLNGTTVVGHAQVFAATRCTITQTGIADSVLMLRGDGAYAIGCTITTDGVAIAGIDVSTAPNCRVESCSIIGATDGGDFGGITAGNTGTLTILNCRSKDWRWGYNFGDATGLTTITFRNNTEEGSTTDGLLVTNLGEGVLDADYNTFQDATVDADYGGAKAHDSFGTAPAYTDGVPTASGNLDGNGDATVTLTSNYDINDYDRLSAAGTICRGPSQIPYEWVRVGHSTNGNHYDGRADSLGLWDSHLAIDDYEDVLSDGDGVSSADAPAADLIAFWDFGGDTAGAWAADAGTMSLQESFAEKIVNGTFDTDIAGWTNNGTYPFETAEYSLGKMHLASSGDGTPAFGLITSTAVSVISGKLYRIRYTQTQGATGNLLCWLSSSVLGDNIGFTASHGDTRTKDQTFAATATDATAYVEFYSSNTAARDWLVDNVSLQAAEIQQKAGIVKINCFDGSISYIQDLSNNSNNSNQAILSKRPLFIADAINDYGIIRFDGTDDYFDSTLAAQPNSTIFFVGKIDGAETVPFGVSDTTNNSYITSDASNNFGGGIADEDYSTIVSDENASSSYFIGVLDNNGTTVHLYFDGGLEYEAAQTGSISTSENYYVGALNDGGTPSSYFEGDIAEIIVYDSALARVYRRNILKYLSNRYDITITYA